MNQEDVTPTEIDEPIPCDPVEPVDDGEVHDLSAVANGEGVLDEAARRKMAKSGHLTLLTVSSIVIFLSMVLRVPGEEKVLVPLINQPIPGLCVSKEWLGINCPGCGMTRCFISLGHLQPERAWHFNPVGLIVFGIVLSVIPWNVAQLYRIRAKLPPLQFQGFNFVLGVTATLLIVQWIIGIYFNYFA